MTFNKYANINRNAFRNIQYLMKDVEHKVYSVASRDSDTIENDYDFKTLNDALVWSKYVGSEIHSYNGFTLMLDGGTHILTSDDYLKSNIYNDDTIDIFIQNTNINILCNNDATIYFDFGAKLDDTSRIVFSSSYVNIDITEIRNLDTSSNLSFNISFNSSSAILKSMYAVDAVIESNMNSIINIDSVKFSESTEHNKNLLNSSLSSNIIARNSDFTSADFNINAYDNSKILLDSCVNTDELIYNVNLNTMHCGMAEIFDTSLYSVNNSRLMLPVEEPSETSSLWNDNGTVKITQYR